VSLSCDSLFGYWFIYLFILLAENQDGFRENWRWFSKSKRCHFESNSVKELFIIQEGKLRT
jgi:hypothetical protein